MVIRFTVTFLFAAFCVATLSSAQDASANETETQTTEAPKQTTIEAKTEAQVTTQTPVSEAQTESTECPPIPNCDRGYTCKEILPHPDNCPMCKCVPCENKPCSPEKGYGCVFEQDSTGCFSCRCTKCPDLGATPCHAPCVKTKSTNGCPICKCPGTTGSPAATGAEIENKPLGDAPASNNSFDP
ncbi:uncharacterized protein LOC135397156 isoform X2 [Ornithodoros turicata]|uniref:uncharacterized protein LOC135397156 isoform X2 n=1 Tax=Ornithodoros turicata TaxID=34597 RepID=UPI00313881B1